MHLSLNGRIVPRERALISVDDRGFQFGDGIFETLRAYHGRPFHLREHWRRLLFHARKLRLRVPFTLPALERVIAALVRRNGLPEATIKIIVTRGVGRGTAFDGRWTPTWLVTVKPLEIPAPAVYRDGVAVRIPAWRQNVHGLLSHYKTLNYLERVFTREQTRALGLYESIFLNTEGEVAEGTYTNVFLVKRGRIITPHLGASVLPGVTRQVVLRLCRKARIPITERRVMPHDLRTADEVFLTNSLIEVLPIVQIDGRKVAAGIPGPTTRILMEAYRKEVAS